MEFMDIECPFCRRLAFATDSLRAEFPADVAVVIQHFPLSNHGSAQGAALAIECAAAQTGFERLYALLFAQQDSLGIKQWKTFASEAGVEDIDEFERCINEHETLPRIEYGLALGQRIGVRGTPTVVINGWKLARPPSLDDLRKSVRATLAGGRPVEIPLMTGPGK
jgi:protein-disulfide isomerase